jgi:hypothetical protein
VKRTEGANYDSAEVHKYFLASGVGFAVARPSFAQDILIAVNEVSEKDISKLKESFTGTTRLFLDSGIFNLTNKHKRAHNCTMDEALALAPNEIDGFDDLLEKYCKIVEAFRDSLWGYIELDQGGEHNKRKTRAMLEGMGFSPIPVYHPLNDSYDYFDELASGYDRICLGNIVQAHPSLRLKILRTVFERRQKYPHLWIHVLGMHPSSSLFSMPMTSCDSSSWTCSMRYGWMNTFAGGKSFGKIAGIRYTLGNKNEMDVSFQMGMRGSCLDHLNWSHFCERKEVALG